MTREQIVNRQQELTNQIHCLVKDSKSIGKSIIKEMTSLQRELDKLDGKTYDCEKWITEFFGESYESLKDARLDLINKIKGLKGVQIGESKNGVVGVTVATEYKIYHYEIHAHYRVEIVKEWKEPSPFGEITKQETRTIYIANIESNGFGWIWRY